jgi:hypothetical protein
MKKTTKKTAAPVEPWTPLKDQPMTLDQAIKDATRRAYQRAFQAALADERWADKIPPVVSMQLEQRAEDLDGLARGLERDALHMADLFSGFAQEVARGDLSTDPTAYSTLGELRDNRVRMRVLEAAAFEAFACVATTASGAVSAHEALSVVRRALSEQRRTRVLLTVEKLERELRAEASRILVTGTEKFSERMMELGNQLAKQRRALEGDAS